MAERDPIRVDVSVVGSATVVAPKGEIGSHEQPAFRLALKQVLDKKPVKTIVDLAGVEYMSTAGLATLVEALQLSRRSQMALVLCGMTPKVRAIFEIARLHTVFRIVDTVDQALST